RVTGAMTLVMALLSMGPNLHVAGNSLSQVPLPWSLLSRLPLVQNLLPSRLAVFTDLGAALLVAFAVAHRTTHPSRLRHLWRGVAAVAVMVTLAPAPGLPWRLTTAVDIPPYFTSSEVQRIPEGSTVLVAPWTTDTRHVQP